MISRTSPKSLITNLNLNTLPLSSSFPLSSISSISSAYTNTSTPATPTLPQTPFSPNTPLTPFSSFSAFNANANSKPCSSAFSSHKEFSGQKELEEENREWATPVEIEDEDLCFDGKPVSVLYEENRRGVLGLGLEGRKRKRGHGHGKGGKMGHAAHAHGTAHGGHHGGHGNGRK